MVWFLIFGTQRGHTSEVDFLVQHKGLILFRLGLSQASQAGCDHYINLWTDALIIYTFQVNYLFMDVPKDALTGVGRWGTFVSSCQVLEFFLFRMRNSNLINLQ